MGSPGARTLQDFFVDRKVPRRQRERVPLVVDADGRIVWVAGYSVDEAFRVTEPAQGMIILRLKGVGGSV
jgi:tRNA(Ile)-lysidine synthase